MTQGLMSSWSDHKIDFALSFLGRALSLDRNGEAQLHRRVMLPFHVVHTVVTRALH